MSMGPGPTSCHPATLSPWSRKTSAGAFVTLPARSITETPTVSTAGQLEARRRHVLHGEGAVGVGVAEHVHDGNALAVAELVGAGDDDGGDAGAGGVGDDAADVVVVVLGVEDDLGDVVDRAVIEDAA